MSAAWSLTASAEFASHLSRSPQMTSGWREGFPADCVFCTRCPRPDRQHRLSALERGAEEILKSAPRQAMFPGISRCRYSMKNGQAVEPGTMGEIAVKSRYTAAGYWRTPVSRRSDFRLSWTAPERMVSSGDLARLDQEGRLEFRGQEDGRIKIRGNRIELGCRVGSAQGAGRQAGRCGGFAARRKRQAAAGGFCGLTPDVTLVHPPAAPVGGGELCRFQMMPSRFVIS